MNCTCIIICVILLWLVPHPIVILLTYGSMECNKDVWCMCDVQYPKRQSSSLLPLWEPEISA
jgi:hypothetical protein